MVLFFHMDQGATEIWTVGHSTHSILEFAAILQAHHIAALADVRRFPGSRKFPQFNQEEFSKYLERDGIEYAHFPELGGRRRARPDSPNTIWRNESFRGYADYMMTESFQLGIQRLLELVERKRTAIMCAEALWWQCHRSLISDFLKIHGCTVHHILSATKTEEHPFTSAARIVDGKLSYSPAESAVEFQFG
jgi:uncharacterized protein (DUF488 family)